MKTFYKILAIIFCSCQFISVLAQEKDFELKSETTSNFSLKDPRSFLNADSMHMLADTLPYSSRAELSMRIVNQKIDKGRMIEKDEVWDELLKLEPYRMNGQVVVGIERIARKLSVLIRNFALKDNSSVSVQDLIKHSELYKAGNLEDFIKDSRALLTRYPNNLDIRNNLALALMHNKKDLCALLELETVHYLEPSHIPAMVNLTVVYERLGRRADAENLANKIVNLQDSLGFKLPQAIHNASWYQYLKENYSKADSLLLSMGWSDLKNSDNSSKLRQFSIKKKLQGVPFYKSGLLIRIGLDLKKDFFSWYLIVGTILIMVIALVLFGKKKKGSKINFFMKLLIMSLILAIVYIAAWGLPSTGYWWYFAGYSLLPFILTVAFGMLAVVFS